MSPLNRSVLLLNRSWVPIDLVNAKKAISVLFKTSENGVYKSAAINLQDMTLHTVASPWVLSQRQSTEENNKEHESIDFIFSAQLKIRIPQAIVLSEFKGMSGPRKIGGITFQKYTMFCRDNFSCCYCGKQFTSRGSLTVDHVVPISKGGTSHYSNCVSACKECNAKKSNRLLSEAGLRLRVKPGVPTVKQVQSALAQRYMKVWNELLEEVDLMGRDNGDSQTSKTAEIGE